MIELNRQSPVVFNARALKTELRGHWPVVAAYEDEGHGPWLTDLSHNGQWDLQDARIDERAPAGIAVQQTPGECRLQNRILVSRLNRTQAVIWHLGGQAAPPPAETGYTDISEANAFLALYGPGVFTIAEKLSALDLLNPHLRMPFLLQGPFSQVPCRIAVLARDQAGNGTLLVTCARGYAGAMVGAIRSAGAFWGLAPAGENRFLNQLAPMNHPE